MSNSTIEERFKLAIKFRDTDKLQDAIKEFQEIINTYPNHPKLSKVFAVLAGMYYVIWLNMMNL